MLAPKGLKSPWNNSETMLAAEAFNVLMWVLAVTLCGALISRRFLVQQPWLSSSLSKMWKGEFCLNFLFSFVKLQNNPDLKKKNSGKICILVTGVWCLSLKQIHQNSHEVLVVLYFLLGHLIPTPSPEVHHGPRDQSANLLQEGQVQEGLFTWDHWYLTTSWTTHTEGNQVLYSKNHLSGYSF